MLQTIYIQISKTIAPDHFPHGHLSASEVTTHWNNHLVHITVLIHRLIHKKWGYSQIAYTFNSRPLVNIFLS